MRDDITLYFIRHGQTDWNFTRRIQGQIDININQIGRAQAASTGQRLKNLRSDVAKLNFVASPLKRCCDTMQIIRKVIGMPGDGYETDDRLKEIHFGNWQGVHWSQVAAVDPEGSAVRALDPYNWRPDNGESYADLTLRVGQWLSSVAGDTVVVSHGGVSRALRKHILNIDPIDMTELSVPQDKILILRKGQMAWA